jgi:hypothetical protein
MFSISRLISLATLVPALLATGCSDSDVACDPACNAPEVCIGGTCIDPNSVTDALPGIDAQPPGRDALPSGDTGPGGSDGPVSDAGSTDTGEFMDADVVRVARVTVTPTSASLVSVNGSTPSQQFTVGAVYTDGSTAAIAQPSLHVDPVELGTFSPAGLFTVTGRVGGRGRVIARVDGVEGEAAVLVRLEETTIVPGTPTTAPSLFEVLIDDPNREARILYPLDGAVMPQNVAPAEIQWERSASGDIFRITLSKPNVAGLIYSSTGVANFRNSHLPDLVSWRRIAQSEPTEWAEIRVDRWIAATNESIRGTPVRVRFPRAALLGSVYYWDIAAGRIVRINDGTTTREQFMPSPRLNCIGCHAVSPSGRYMAGRYGGGDNIAGAFDLTRNLTTNPPEELFTVTSTTIRWWFASWSPDESRLVVSVNEQGSPRGLRFVDPFRGRFVDPIQGQLPQGAVSHPAWAPDGSAIAYVGDMNNWGGDNTAGSIYVLPMSGTGTVGMPRRVLSGTVAIGLPMGSAANYPTWSPDSQWIAFAHGNSSRSESGRSALYVMRRDGSGVVRLDNASGGANGDVAFQPRFSPFEQDGYIFLSFLSRRPYGNAQAGTGSSGRQQIWVTAIRVSANPGEDPSEVPYWLPGQNPASLNISAFWSPRACRNDAEGCTVNAECCSGACEQNANQELVCVPPPMECRRLGEACTQNEQCCDAALCIDMTCGGL